MIDLTFIVAIGMLWTACVAAIAYRLGTVREHMRTAPRIIAAKAEAYQRGRQSVQTFDYEALERHSAIQDPHDLANAIMQLQRGNQP